MPDVFESSGTTSRSLLRRVRDHDPTAWERFAAIYTPLVYSWARRGGLQENDAEDVVQDVFRTVLAKIGDFQKQGQDSRFRNWLWAITRNRVRLHYRQNLERVEPVGGEAATQRLQQCPDWLESECDPSNQHEHAALLARAVGSIKDDFEERSWQAFWRVTVGNETVAQVAESLEMSTSAVRQAKYRVLCRLREELAGL